MTLTEATFDTAQRLIELGQREGRVPRIVSLSSVDRGDKGEACIYLDLDDPNANSQSPGLIIVYCNERDVLHLSQDELLEAFIGDGAGGTKH